MNPPQEPETPTHERGFVWAQYGLVGFGLLLLVLLLLADQTAPLDTRSAPAPQQPAPPETPLEQAAAQGPLPRMPLPDNEAAEFRQWEERLAKASNAQDSMPLLENLVRVGRALDRNDHAAHYAALALGLAPDDTARLAQAARLHRAAYNQIEDGQSAGAKAYRARALELFDRLLEKRPQDLDAKIDRALLRVASDQPMAGIQELVKIAEEHPKYYRPHLELGIFSIQTRQFDKARERLEKARQARPSAWEPHFYLALLDEEQGRKTEAAENYRKALEAKPEPGVRQIIEEKLKDF